MKFIQCIFLFICALGYGQAVSVKEINQDPSALVNALLDNACVQVSNASISSAESIAYFNNNGGDFPISEGVLIRSGKAKLTEGSYTGKGISSQVNSNGDPDLERINNSSGQSPAITDVAFLEFDFVPLSSNFNFNFLFASNEYGEWQCVSSDVFAFLLTDLTTGETTNLAVIPGTNVPVSVRNIKDNSYNASCQSDNPKLFGSYQVNNPATSTVNMRGYTKIMTAAADIEPGRPYRIRLVIGDSNDANYDSAIFLEAGSFSANVDLGEDRSFCAGDMAVIGTELDTSLYAHSWTYNGKIIPAENTNSLTVTKSGTYGVRVSKNGTSCLVTDEIVFSELEVQAPADLEVCYSEEGKYIYDLTANNEMALGINDLEYDLRYYTSYNRISNGISIPENQLKEFKSSGNQTIFVQLKNNFSKNACDAIYSFRLLVNDPVEAHKPEPIETCNILNSDVEVDLMQVEPEILGVQDPNIYSVSFYASREDAENATKKIANPTSYSVSSGKKMSSIWARVDNSSTGCYATVSIDIVLNDPPPVDELEDVVVCSQYVLPELTHGNYFTKPGGTGTALFAGDVITKPGVYYIFNGPDENGCTNESSFKVTIIQQYGIGEKYCGQFVVPTPPEGAFYSQPRGPAGAGVELLPGTVLTSNQVIFYYAEIEGELCRDEAFNIIILPLPPVDEPEDVITCGSYTLPALQDGKYFKKPAGEGSKLKPGTKIEASQTLYVFNENETCTNEHVFDVTIIPDFENIVACGSYELPAVEVGSFYTKALGQGKEIPAGSIISTSQTIFYYTEITGTINCTDNLSFEVEILPIPKVDQLEDVLICEADVFTLPELTYGEYFTEANRSGTQLFPGALIKESDTIYINNLENTCSNESQFKIEVRPLPTVENFTDIYTCAAYELPVLRYGKYFTQPGGKGEQFYGGDIIWETKTLYVYNTWEDLTTCYSENAFTIYVEGIDVGDFEDVAVCDSYTLPPISKGNYYTESNGKGKKLKAGQKITTTQRIYVFSSNGTRFICTDEDSFMVNVSKTPELPAFPDIESCGSYTLPDLSQDEYNVGYYWETGGKAPISASEKTISVPGNYTIYVYASAKNNASCVSGKKFNITVHPLLDLTIDGATLCRNAETGEVQSEAYLNSGLNPSEFEVNWYFEDVLVHTGPDFYAAEAGEYTVETVKLKPEKGASCNYKPTSVVVKESGKPTISADVTEVFADVAVIRISVDKGFGEYEYQMDGGQFQSSNEFYDVSSGEHIINVRGVSGNCGQANLSSIVLKFPHFFSPNKDGSNETWTIPDLKDHPEAEISIFDRYGKLLTTFPPTESWDGTFHGREMPSDDYWFRVTFKIDGVAKDFKSHFTLMR